ncbi:MAG: Gfo/Idh/MocA family oxidoreductase [Bryobacteraceae bacterium]|jgi:predicted dehydrogenase
MDSSRGPRIPPGTFSQGITRRGAIGALAAASYNRLLGANDRVQVGFIGYGLIGVQHVKDFKNLKDVDCAALAEVYQPRLEAGLAAMGGSPKPYSDFRKMLDNKDLQAIVVCTPDHWHALLTMMSCAAGKDVYVEKPMTLFIKEGRWMTQVARKHNRVVQVGTQQRSGKHYQHARALMQSGYIGKIMSVRFASSRNISPGFMVPPDSQAPAYFDYDMWLGPAPQRPYNKMRGIYHFRWFWDYAGGQMTNLGAHELDIVQWVLKAKGPKTAYSAGGRLVLKDGCETPDTQDAIWEYPSCTANYSIREAAAGPRTQGGGLQFFGDKGTLTINRSGFEIASDTKTDPLVTVPGVRQGTHPIGGPSVPANVPSEPWIKELKEPGSSDDQFADHARNFVDCVKSRQRPISDVEEGFEVSTAYHLANLSLQLGRKLQWDAEKETIVGDKEAAAKLERPYRKPWDAVLRGLLG